MVNTRRWLAQGVVLSALVLVSTACSASVTTGSPRVTLLPPSDIVFVIPAGTASAEMRGEEVISIPSRIDVTIGQSVLIRNEDHAMHYFFDAPIAPGESVRKTFERPGTFGYTSMLSCSLAKSSSQTVVVHP